MTGRGVAFAAGAAAGVHTLGGGLAACMVAALLGAAGSMVRW